MICFKSNNSCEFLFNLFKTDARVVKPVRIPPDLKQALSFHFNLQYVRFKISGGVNRVCSARTILGLYVELHDAILSRTSQAEPHAVHQLLSHQPYCPIQLPLGPPQHIPCSPHLLDLQRVIGRKIPCNPSSARRRSSDSASAASAASPPSHTLPAPSPSAVTPVSKDSIAPAISTTSVQRGRRLRITHTCRIHDDFYSRHLHMSCTYM